MRRSVVEIEIALLHVLAVIALLVGQPEQTLLDDGILPVPERESEAKPLPLVADASQSVFAPVVSARARLVVAEVVPGIAVVAVVLADGAPLAFAEVRPPGFPGGGGVAGRGEALVLGIHWFHCGALRNC